MNILLFILICNTASVIILIVRGLSWYYFNKIIDDSTNNRIHNINNSPEEVIDNSESEDIYTSQFLPALRAQRIVQAQQMRNMQFAPQDKYAAMNVANLLNRHD
jgi:hypothetical protein